jgi:flagellar hook protein FlgE
MGLTTFSTALSGIATNSQGLSVVGNNLANLNTVGYKASNISFTDVLGQSISTVGTQTSGNTSSVGLGAQVSAVRETMTQGTLQTTNNPLDVAIQGKGFFVIKNGEGQFYSRAGNFHLDANGNLVTDSGATVQGYIRNPATGKVDSTLGLSAIKIPSSVDNPIATTGFEIGMNLDAGAPSGTKFNSAIQLYDSLGQAHVATLTLQKEISTGSTPVTKWRFDITIPNNEIAGVAATDTQRYSLITGAIATASPAAGALVFDSAGKLKSAYIGADPSTLPTLADISFPTSSVTLPAMANGAALSTAFTWKLLADPVTPNISGFASSSEVTSSTQNGTGAGSLSNLSIGPDGAIRAVFNNGKNADIAQLVLAQFANVDGLLPQGGGLYTETNASGAALFGTAGSGGRGQMLSATLEQSNVDLASELTKIITYQRGYQANARMITVTDQIMQETMNLRQ